MELKEALYQYLLILGDNSMILGHRLSELCGHGPSLETDIALTNISLDLFGQVRSIFQYAAKVSDNDITEDDIAMLRKERHYRNVVLVEQANKDFAHVIIRSYLYDVFQLMQLEQLEQSSDEMLRAIAIKTIKETKYHKRFSAEWTKRLAGGTDISLSKTQAALDHLYPFAYELFEDTDEEKTIEAHGICPAPSSIKESYFNEVSSFLKEAGLKVPETPARRANGKTGIHSEAMGYILGELQYMQKTYPNMSW